jgi:hypothetical protein
MHARDDHNLGHAELAGHVVVADHKARARGPVLEEEHEQLVVAPHRVREGVGRRRGGAAEAAEALAEEGERAAEEAWLRRGDPALEVGDALDAAGAQVISRGGERGRDAHVSVEPVAVAHVHHVIGPLGEKGVEIPGPFRRDFLQTNYAVLFYFRFELSHYSSQSSFFIEILRFAFNVIVWFTQRRREYIVGHYSSRRSWNIII